MGSLVGDNIYNIIIHKNKVEITDNLGKTLFIGTKKAADKFLEHLKQENLTFEDMEVR